MGSTDKCVEAPWHADRGEWGGLATAAGCEREEAASSRNTITPLSTIDIAPLSTAPIVCGHLGMTNHNKTECIHDKS